MPAMIVEELVELFDLAAQQERQLAACFRITGRYDMARRHEARSEAFAEAAALARGDYGRAIEWARDVVNS